jgi:hypothetical protein
MASQCFFFGGPKIRFCKNYSSQIRLWVSNGRFN